MSTKQKILVVGSFVMDLIVRTRRVPREGETVIEGLSFSTAPGGKGANQAVQAARLGIDVTMVGKVGRDMFGDQLIKSAEEAGIDTRYVMRADNASTAVGNIIIEVKEGEKAKNRIIVVPGANMALTVDDVAFLKDKISDYDMVMLQLEIPLEVNEAVVDYANAAGVPVMLNSAPPQPLSDSFLKKLDYISPNEHEAAAMTGVRIVADKNGVDLGTVKEAANSLLAKGVRNVIITLGSNGVAFANGKDFIYKPCIDIVEVLDPTAAGDSFVGSFCSALCMGFDVDKALDFANYAATLTVSRLGAQPSLPFYNEVVNLMESDGYKHINLFRK